MAIKSIVFQGRKEFTAETYSAVIRNNSSLAKQDAGFIKGYGEQLGYILIGSNQFRLKDGLFQVAGRLNIIELGTVVDVVVPLQASAIKGYIIAKIQTSLPIGENLSIEYKLGDATNFPTLTQDETYEIPYTTNATYEMALYSFTINNTTMSDIVKLVQPITNTPLQVAELASDVADDLLDVGGIFIKKETDGSYTPYYKSGVTTTIRMGAFNYNKINITGSSISDVPLTINALSGQTNHLGVWAVNNIVLAYISNSGYLGTPGIFNTAAFNNAYLQMTSTGVVANRNIADSNSVLKVNLVNASASGAIAEFQWQGVSNARVSKDGRIATRVGIENYSDSAYAKVDTTTTGVVISRDFADANSPLKVNLANASATGSIAEFQKAGVSLVTITKDGYIVAPYLFASNGLVNSVGSANAYVNVATTGTVISRNINDANPALIVNEQQGTGDILRLQYGGDVKARFDANGYLGLGIAPSGYRFHLYKTGTSYTRMNGGDIDLVADNSSQPMIRANLTGTADIIQLNDNGVTVFVVKDGGNVGVGTNSPNYPLDVSSLTDVFAGRFIRNTPQTAGSATSLLIVRKSQGDMIDGFGVALSFGITDNSAVENYIANIGALRQGADNSGVLYFNTYLAGASSEKMRITSTGEVLIGTTTSAGTKMTVAGSIALTTGSVYSNSIRTYSGTLLTILNGGSDVAYFNGKVGVGINAPSSQLHVHVSTSSDSTLILSNSVSGTTTNDGLHLWMDGTNSGVINKENGYFSIGTNLTERIRVTSIGNVGIAIDLPLYKLHVNGDVGINGHLYDSDASAGTDGQVLSRDSGGIKWRDPKYTDTYLASGTVATTASISLASAINNFDEIVLKVTASYTDGGIIERAVRTYGYCKAADFYYLLDVGVTDIREGLHYIGTNYASATPFVIEILQANSGGTAVQMIVTGTATNITYELMGRNY